MRGIVLSTLSLGGKTYKYNDICKGIVPSGFRPDKFYGGRVSRFGKTNDGLMLCLEKDLEQVIDIFVDLDALEGVPYPVLQQIAGKVKDKKLAHTPEEKKADVIKAFQGINKTPREELIKLIRDNAVEVLSNE
jgi:hypothetical protein